MRQCLCMANDLLNRTDATTMTKLFLFAFLASSLLAQSKLDGVNVVGTTQIHRGTTLPGTCSPGQVFIETTRWRLYVCPVSSWAQVQSAVLYGAGVPSVQDPNACNETAEIDGRIYVNTTGTSSSTSVYYCAFSGAGTAAWAAFGTGGVGVSDYSALTTFKPVRTSAQIITIGTCTTTSPCTYSFDNTAVQVTSTITATRASGTTGTVYFYIDASGVKAAATSGLTVTCSGCTASTGVTGFPAATTPHIPIGTATVSSSAFDAAGVIDLRPAFTRNTKPIAGAGITDTAGTWSVSGSESSTQSPRILKAGFSGATTSSTTAVSQVTYALAHADLAVGDIVRVTCRTTHTGVANAKNVTIRFQNMDLVLAMSSGSTFGEVFGEFVVTATTAQEGYGRFISSVGLGGTTVADTASVDITTGGPSNIEILTSVTNAGDSISLRQYNILLIKAQ
jgi:hypothetical protein